MAFGPEHDYPPDGASVETFWGGAMFRNGDLIGWYTSDGRYYRPSDEYGQYLARRWAAQTATKP